MSEVEKVLAESYDSLKESMDKAEQSTVPFPVVTPDDEIKIVGDANNTTPVVSSYVVSFLIPISKAPNLNAPTVGNNKLYVHEYKDITLPVEKAVVISSYVSELIPYFYKPKEDGEVVEYEMKEQIEIRKNFADESFLNNLRNIVKALLDMEDDLLQYVTYKTLLSITLQLFDEHPEIVNESFSFFV